MTIQLRSTALQHLDNAPLKVALAQVRFAPVHAIEKRERVADFQELLSDSYIAGEGQTPQTVTIQFGNESVIRPAAIAAPETVWPFDDPARGWSVALSSTSLALEAGTYQDFDDFLDELRSVLGALEEAFDPKRRTRLGLRYINEITDRRLAEDGLVSLLRKELVSPVGTALGSDLAGSLNELRFREKLGTFVLRHGLVREDAYLLDFDYFNEESGDCDKEAIVSMVEQFHDLIEPLFVWCLSKNYLQELKSGG